MPRPDSSHLRGSTPLTDYSKTRKLIEMVMHFTALIAHHLVSAGHNTPEEEPQAVAQAVFELRFSNSGADLRNVVPGIL